MQIIVKALGEIFPKSDINVDSGNVTVKIPSLTSEHLAKLGDLSILYNVQVKRSKNGLIVIVEIPKEK